MIDIHMHSPYSDGDKSLEYILNRCEEKKLHYISITDHNTCKAYQDDLIINNKIFSGKIIKGIEMDASLDNGRKIEILGYNIKDERIVEEWSQRFFSKEILRKKQDYCKKTLLSICDKKGLIYNIDDIKKDIAITDFPNIYVYYELMKHEENYKILGKFTESLSIFIREGLTNPNSEFYIDESIFPKPKYQDVVNVIHKAGGLAFLAHPFEYRFENTFEIIDEIRANANLDGIECFHPSAEVGDRINILINYAKENNLFMSGGSDFHGDKKPNIDIGIGNGSLNIEDEIIENWIKI